MSKKQKVKIVGNIDKYLIKKYGLSCGNKTKIVQSLGLYKHIAKHAEEYISVESLELTTANIEAIIREPNYVFYNQETESLEYYKKLLENVSVVVKKNNKEFYIASVYPVTQTKIDNRKAKEFQKEYEEETSNM